MTLSDLLITVGELHTALGKYLEKPTKAQSKRIRAQLVALKKSVPAANKMLIELDNAK